MRLPGRADAVLFNYTHDILRTPAAVDNLMGQAKPGATIAIAGMKFFPWWTGPLNLLPWLKNRPYNARPADLWHAWDLIERWCDGFERASTQWGMGYIAHGRRRQEPKTDPMPCRGRRRRRQPSRWPALRRRARADRCALAAPLSRSDCQVQSMPDASPTKWHLAHTTWFFETFVLERCEPGFAPFDSAFRVLFNSLLRGRRRAASARRSAGC